MIQEYQSRESEALEKWMEALIFVWRTRASASSRNSGAGLHGAGLSEAELASLARGVSRLNRGFTGNRKMVGQAYLDDPELLGAYLLYYWPKSYLQASRILNDGGARLPEAESVCDVGSGPGAMAAAFVDASLFHGLGLKLTLVDHVAGAPEIFREALVIRLGASGTGDFPVSVVAADLSNPETAKKIATHSVVVFGHSLNETQLSRGAGRNLGSSSGGQPSRMGVLESWESRASSFVLIVEPALQTTTRNLLSLRDEAAASGSRILGPCFYQGPCPALAQEGGTCHGRVTSRLPRVSRVIGERAGLSTDDLAMAWLAYRPAAAKDSRKSDQVRAQAEVPTETVSPSIDASSDAEWRVTSESLLNKAGRTRFSVCGPGGRVSLSLKRGELGGGPCEAAFFSLGRGDAIRLVNPVRRENGFGVGQDTELERL